MACLGATCVVADDGGAFAEPGTLSTTHPLDGAGAWARTDNVPMDHLSCAADGSSLCVGWTVFGPDVTATTTPAGTAADWSTGTGVAVAGDHVAGVSCPTATTCVAVTSQGAAVVGTLGATVGGGSTPPVTAPAPAPSYTGPDLVGGTSYRVANDAIAFALNSANDVTGSIAAMTAATYAAGPARPVAEARGKRKHVKVGTAAFTLHAGVTSTVRLRLTKAARALLARTHRLKVLVTVTAHTAAGQTTTSVHKVTIKAAR